MNGKKGVFSSAIIVAFGLLTLATTADAREKVTCTFTVQQDAVRNVKPASFTDTEKVRRREYNRLVSSDRNAYRVTVDGGKYCRLRHIENVRLSVRVKKSSMKLTPQGRVPNCADFQIGVSCAGS